MQPALLIRRYSDSLGLNIQTMQNIWLRRALRALMLFVALPYLAVCILVFTQQNALLYPAEPQATPPDLRQWPAWQALTTSGEALAYWREPVGTARGTVVLFHGNGGTALDRSFYADALTPLGYRTVLAEYPGYGGRGGKPGEAALVADARQLIDLVAQRFSGPIIVWGESLGAGVAAAAMAQGHPRVRSIALLTPWNTLADAAGSHYPYLPVRWLLRDRYDSSANLRLYDGRLAVVVAGDDHIIPSRLGEALYAEHPGEKRLWRFARSDHNDWHDAADPLWWREIMAYLDPQ